jgi:hypothetical protein
MLNYTDYIFEKKINSIFLNIDESIIQPEYNYYKNFNKLKKLIPKNVKFWDEFNLIKNEYPKKIEKFVLNLINKSLPFLKNLTLNQSNILINKLFSLISFNIKDIKFRKKVILLIFLFITSTTILNNKNIVVGDILHKDEILDIIHTLKPKEIKKIDINNTETSVKPDMKSNTKSYEKFLNRLSFKESTNIWNSIRYVHRRNRKIPVYVGKYQFGNIAFRDIKSPIRVNDFAKNPDIWPEKQQDIDIYKLFRNNLYYLRKTKYFKGYDYYIGKKINNVIITKSGILASAHLVGNNSLKKFLKTNGENDPKDGNGVKCSYYMNEFKGYDIPF